VGSVGEAEQPTTRATRRELAAGVHVGEAVKVGPAVVT
jgi:hypothetical protein